mmetsp:Transcript_18307/g.43802  ORF Transcript_18307/g.43802 Transcript_18307/m.43802 type:complete len:222 (+) Transcript_18307:260-925(+)
MVIIVRFIKPRALMFNQIQSRSFTADLPDELFPFDAAAFFFANASFFLRASCSRSLASARSISPSILVNATSADSSCSIPPVPSRCKHSSKGNVTAGDFAGAFDLFFLALSGLSPPLAHGDLPPGELEPAVVPPAFALGGLARPLDALFARLAIRRSSLIATASSCATVRPSAFFTTSAFSKPFFTIHSSSCSRSIRTATWRGVSFIPLDWRSHHGSRRRL